MKRTVAVILIIALILSGCTACAAPEYQKYTYRFFGTFDTIITLVAYTESEASFQEYCTLAQSEMLRYHMIYDLYNPYDGVNNLYAVNQNAGVQATPAEPELIDLLLQIREWHVQYGDVANPAMGAVLSLWHDARTSGTFLPDDTALKEAAAHTDYNDVVIDQENGTVFFKDPSLKLDLGAVAKGYAAELVSNTLSQAGLTSFILNAGGNVICGPEPLDDRTEWAVAIEDVDGLSTKMVIGANNLSIVTSGDYQRYFEYEGKQYHHLIDPKTLYPAEYMRAVTILHPDSGFADFLSTTAFLLPVDESIALISSIPEAEGLWTTVEGEFGTEGFYELVR